jgi:putative transposase
VARKLRIQYAGAVYHVMNRGDRREAVFKDDQDYEGFLRALGEACQKTLWQVHAYCLMPNHFHLVIETPQPTLVAGMKWLLGTYTSRCNRRHKQCGHLFSGRYKALIVDGSGDGYLKSVCDYVHLNPARAKLLGPEQPLEVFRWSSYPLYLGAPRRRPIWLRVERLLGEWGIGEDSAVGRRVFAQCMERRRGEEVKEEFRRVERGWCLGDEEFRQELLEQVSKGPGASHYGEAVQEAVEVRAERLVARRLKAMRWTEKDLTTRRKGDPKKVKLAAAVRAETTMSVAWIAERLGMGSRGYLTWLLYRKGKM